MEFFEVAGSVCLPVSPFVFVCGAVSFVEVPESAEFVDFLDYFELWGVFCWSVGDWGSCEE